MRRVFEVLTVAALFICAPGLASAEDWGVLSGQFIYDGVPPTPEKVNISSDQEVCCQHDLKVESLLVDPESKGVRNIIIYLYQNKTSRRATPYDKKEVPVHEDYLGWEREPVKLDNNKCRFDPHVALVWTRQKVILGNSDPIGHNVKIDCRENPQSNDTIPSGGVIERTFKDPERFPASVSCSIHPWMKGWLVIRDTPYMAVSDKDGKFEIKNLPVGEWQFMVWQEQAGYVSEVLVQGQKVSWKKGILQMKIVPGENALGKILLAPELFK